MSVPEHDGANDLLRISPGRFDLRLDLRIGIVFARLIGFWEVTDAEDYFRARRELGAVLHRRQGFTKALLDMRDYPPQSQAVVSACETHIASYNQYEHVVAILTGGRIMRLQFQRISKHFRVRTFDSPSEALSWLNACHSPGCD